MDDIRQIFGAGIDSGGTPAEKAPEPVVIPQEVKVSPGVVPTTTPMTSMANYVMSRFQENHDARDESGVSRRLDYYLRAQKCEFTEQQRETLMGIFGNEEMVSHIFVPITAVKNRAAKAMLVDLINQGGDPLFHIAPTPSPDVPEEVSAAVMEKSIGEITSFFSQMERAGVQELPPEVMAKVQQLVANMTENKYDDMVNAEEAYARDRAKRLEKKVWDVMEEGGFNDAFRDYVENICVYGTGVIVGPVVRSISKNSCVKDKKTGVVKFKRVSKAVPIFESINPQDCYPAPDARRIDDGPLCITVKYTGDVLWQYVDSSDGKKVRDGEGWMPDVVREILRRHPRGGVKIDVKQFNPERRMCENNGFSDTHDCTFEGIRCFATVRGSELISMGILKNRDKKQIETGAFYRTETIVIDNYVVYCRIYDRTSDLPVSKGCFYTLPGSWWGESIADKVASVQTCFNNCLKSMLQNMTNSAGPVWWVSDVQRLADKSPNALKIRSGKVISFLTSLAGNSGAPVGAISVPSTASELLNVWQAMLKQADIDSGIPAYTEGQSAGAGGALRTSSGLQTFVEQQMRGMKMIMSDTDKSVISPIARRTADWVLLNDDDISLRGDVEVRSVGLIGKALKAQRDNARVQLLNLVLQSQFLQQIIGPKGIVSLFRPSLMDIDINPDDVIPSKSKLDEMEVIQGIQQIFQATNGDPSGGQQQPQQQQGAQQPPAVERPQGGVAERRSVA